LGTFWFGYNLAGSDTGLGFFRDQWISRHLKTNGTSQAVNALQETLWCCGLRNPSDYPILDCQFAFNRTGSTPNITISKTTSKTSKPQIKSNTTTVSGGYTNIASTNDETPPMLDLVLSLTNDWTGIKRVPVKNITQLQGCEVVIKTIARQNSLELFIVACILVGLQVCFARMHFRSFMLIYVLYFQGASILFAGVLILRKKIAPPVKLDTKTKIMLNDSDLRNAALLIQTAWRYYIYLYVWYIVNYISKSTYFL
jgi:hypothetical protein